MPSRIKVKYFCGSISAFLKSTFIVMIMLSTVVMLGLKETIDKLAKGNAVRWYGHVLRREEDNILRKVLCFKVEGQRRRGQPRKTWKNQVEDDIRKIGLKKENALSDQSGKRV